MQNFRSLLFCREKNRFCEYCFWEFDFRKTEPILCFWEFDFRKTEPEISQEKSPKIFRSKTPVKKMYSYTALVQLCISVRIAAFGNGANSHQQKAMVQRDH